MFEIIGNTIELKEGIKVDTYKREIFNANILEVEAGSTGYCGGDSGHGARHYIRLKDLGGTDIRVKIGDKEFDELDKDKGIEIILGGDTELDTIITALKFVTKVLEDAANEVYD